MPTSPAPDVLTAVHTLLKNDPTLSAILVGDKVYVGVVPEGKGFPRIVLGDIGEANAPLRAVFARNSNNDDITIHIYSQKSVMQVMTIYSRVKFLLEQAIVVVGREYIEGTITLIGSPVEPDNITFHGVAIYAVVTRAVA